MIGSRVVSTVMVMVLFVAQLGVSPLVTASRDEDAKIMEVSSGSHFVKRSHVVPATKIDQAHPPAAKLAQVKPHAAELESNMDTAVTPSAAQIAAAKRPKSPLQELATKAE